MLVDDPFCRQILSAPDDVAARLAYADWLEERGDPRGEFIRVQCRLAKGRPGRTAGRRQLKQREQQLLEHYEHQWAKEIQALGVGFAFRRGFIERVWLSIDRFLEHAPKLFAVTPLRGVILVGNPHQLQELAQSPHLARLRHVGFQRIWIGYQGAAVLSESPHAADLKSLDLSNCGLSAAGAAALAASPFLAKLSILKTPHNPGIGDQGVNAIAASDSMIHLRRWNLAGCGVGDAAARTLAVWPRLSQLVRLNLKENAISMAGFDALLSSPYWSPRTVLEVTPTRHAALRRQFGKKLNRYSSRTN